MARFLLLKMRLSPVLSAPRLKCSILKAKNVSASKVMRKQAKTAKKSPLYVRIKIPISTACASASKRLKMPAERNKSIRRTNASASQTSRRK